MIKGLKLMKEYNLKFTDISILINLTNIIQFKNLYTKKKSSMLKKKFNNM